VEAGFPKGSCSNEKLDLDAIILNRIQIQQIDSAAPRTLKSGSVDFKRHRQQFLHHVTDDEYVDSDEWRMQCAFAFLPLLR